MLRFHAFRDRIGGNSIRLARWSRLLLAAGLGSGVIALLGCPLFALNDPQTSAEPDPSPLEEAALSDESAVGLPPTPAASYAAIGPESEGLWQAVERGPVELYIPTMGNLRARRSSRLASQVAGRVDAVLVDVGDRVSAGQALVKIDPSFYEIEVNQREAEVDAARIALADAELLLTRLQGLWNDGENSAIPRQTLDEAQARRDGAEALVVQAKEALSYSRKRLAETVVHAPYDGVVTARLVDPGESVVTNPVTVLLEIQETQVLELLFTLPQEALGRVATGTPLEVRIGGFEDRVEKAVVDKVFPSIDEATRSFTSRALIENPDMEYRPGMLAQVGVLGGRVEDSIRVPRRSLSRQAEGWGVMVLRDGQSVPQSVEVGLMGMETAEVLSGLEEGDHVLVPRLSS